MVEMVIYWKYNLGSDLFYSFIMSPIRCRYQIDEYQNEVAVAEEQIRKLKAANPGVKIDESTV